MISVDFLVRRGDAMESSAIIAAELGRTWWTGDFANAAWPATGARRGWRIAIYDWTCLSLAARSRPDRTPGGWQNRHFSDIFGRQHLLRQAVLILPDRGRGVASVAEPDAGSSRFPSRFGP
jgi:hypothetical protein